MVIETDPDDTFGGFKRGTETRPGLNPIRDLPVTLLPQFYIWFNPMEGCIMTLELKLERRGRGESVEYKILGGRRGSE